MRTTLLFIHLFFLCFMTYAQKPTQTIRGTVIDEDTQLPLIGATIKVLHTAPVIGSITDQSGKFRLENTPIGRVDLSVSFIGYQEKTIPNLEVNSAKEVLLDIALTEAVTSLDEVVVRATANKGDALNDLALVSARSVSSEQTFRFAGGFNDPSKIMSNYAGVSTSHDGGNEIIVRGNSPKYIQWRLEDVQISNPNHFGDQNAISGIVNALNNNLLSASDFYSGAFPAEFGDALSGVYDIRMRKGNNEKFEGIFGLGVLGTDITLEGPFKKGYDGSFLVNYRYSTLGLANKLGLIEVDGANLNFQDAAFKLWLPTRKSGTFSVFGLHGKSNFNFEDVDPSVWVTPGDDLVQTDVSKDYEKGASLLHTGINHVLNLSPKGYLKTSLSYSREKITDHVFEYRLPELPRHLNHTAHTDRTSVRASSLYNHRMNAKNKFNVGFRYNLIRQDMAQNQLFRLGEQLSLIDFNEGIGSLQSFVNWKFSPNDRLNLVTGLQNTNVVFNQKHTIEPRFAINYALTASTKLSFGYGNHSRMESIHHYFTQTRLPDGTSTRPNLDLGLLRANHFVLGYEKRFNNNLRLKIESYYQDLYNIPVENNPNSSFSTLNENLVLRYVDLVNKGTGENYGLEFSLERSFANNYYFVFNASFFESTFTALDNISRNTRFNSNYLVNLLGGKEFAGLGKKKNRILSVNGKLFLSGGRYYVPLLRDDAGNLAVNLEQGLIYDESRAYQKKLDDILNLTISMSHKWNFRKTTHEIYLNIDNATNQRARLMEYFDASQEDGLGYERQVGIIPNLLYRVYF